MNRPIYLRDYGSWVMLDGETLIERPEVTCAWDEYVRKSCGGEDWYEVTAPQEQGYLDAVNKVLGTNFMLRDFPGR